MVAVLHVVISTAIGLIAYGVTALTSANPDANSIILVKVGIATMLLSWTIIAIVAMLSLFLPEKANLERSVIQDGRWRDGTRVCTPLLLRVLDLGEE